MMKDQLVKNCNNWLKEKTSSENFLIRQHTKKVVSDRQGLVDFATRLVNSVFNMPDGQVMFFEQFELRKNCEINSPRQKAFGAS